MINKYGLDDPIAAIATALTQAALGIIRTSGKDCIELVSKVFSRKKALLDSSGNKILHGWIIDGGKKIDEVVLCIYKAPKSFTGEDSVEIICHGGTAVMLAIYKLLIKAGFRKAEGGEFSFRAFINGKTDLTAAEAVKEIIAAETQAASSFAVERLSGNLHDEIEKIKQELLTVIAAAEVEIEYPEEETGGIFNGSILLNPTSKLEKLAASWLSEKVFMEGAKVVLAGKTNVGKSSLFNALLKEDRAIVSDMHGTTRDWLEASLNFKGIPVKLYDTAGFRITNDKIEAIGTERAMQISRASDLILYLIDSQCFADKTDIEFLLNAKQPFIIVLTKADLDGAKNIDTFSAELKKLAPIIDISSIVSVSSKTGSGLEALICKGFNLLTGFNELPVQNASLGTLRQKECVEKALFEVRHAYEAWQIGFPLDALIQDLEQAVYYLAEITGEVKSDDILNAVFSGFCVGK